VALGAIVSDVSLMQCDMCTKTHPTTGRYSMPVAWVQVEVWGGGVWATGSTMHACSKECAARLFHKLCNESGGVPATDRPLLETGRPYR